MTYFDELAKGSAAHRVISASGNFLDISAIDSTTAALKAFQPVYHDALRQAYEAGFRVSAEHWSSQHSAVGFERLYDRLTIYFD
jgi:hypothetical protein